MADRAVGTATSYPVDKQHVGVEDRELARGHWAGAPDNSHVRESTIKYGDTTSGFYEPPAPPPPPATSIGTVIITGDTAGLEVNSAGSYTATNSGDASALAYTWSAVGGTVRGSGRSKNCTVDWTIDGAGSVTCVVSSTDPGVTDNPQDDTLDLTIAPETP